MQNIIIVMAIVLIIALLFFVIFSRIELERVTGEYREYKSAIKQRTDFLVGQIAENRNTIEQFESSLAERNKLIDRLERNQAALESNKQQRQRIYNEISNEFKQLVDSLKRRTELEQRKSEFIKQLFN